MNSNHLALKRFGLLLLLTVLLRAKALDQNITQPNHSPISNTTKKSSDVLVNNGVVLKQKPQFVSQLAGQGNRRIMVQRPFLEDGTEETRAFEEESDESPATDVVSEITGRDRNKEEILDSVRPYKDMEDRRPAAHILGKELNKQKNKGLLAVSQADDDKQAAYASDDSIAEGASRKTLEIYIAEEQADQQKRHDDNRNAQATHNNSGAAKQGNKTKNTNGTGIYRSKTPARNAVFQEALVAHNKFRALHHVLPLQWNATLAEQAQNIAESVASDPSTFQGEPVGENIAQIWHDLQRAPLKATTVWYSEKKTYSFSYPVLNDKVKHFTQMVWKDTNQLGMGAAPSPSGKYVIVVALYRPLGNDRHRLRDNVQRVGPAQDVYATIKEMISKPNDAKKDNNGKT